MEEGGVRLNSDVRESEERERERDMIQSRRGQKGRTITEGRGGGVTARKGD